MFECLKENGFDVRFVSHAKAIVEGDFPHVVAEIQTILLDAHVPIREIIGSGGGEAKGTQRLRRAFAQLGWTKQTFEIRKTINGKERESQSHEVDHVKTFNNVGTIALEIEWNNKDPFFDRDLENFKRLHAEGAISVGIILTRGESLQNKLHQIVLDYVKQEGIGSFEDLDRKFGLTPTRRQRDEIDKRASREKNPIPFQDAWTDMFISDKYGAATTHWRKLLDRINRGVGNPCPLILIGLPASIVALDE